VVRGVPGLRAAVDPFIDGALYNAAIVKRVRAVEVGADITIAGYHPGAYESRDVDTRAREMLERRGAVIVLGRPKSGKTRLLWQLLRQSPDAVIVAPRQPLPPPGFEEAGLRTLRDSLYLLLDDLHGVSPAMDVLEWRRRIEQATGGRCLIVSTSRDGEEWRLAQAHHPALVQTLGDGVIVRTSRSADEGEDMSLEQAQHLAGALALDMSAPDLRTRFDGTPGSITLDLQDMRRRYERMRADVKGDVAMSRLLDASCH
jgi:hypothetical protein